jgi:hypothetical protein
MRFESQTFWIPKDVDSPEQYQDAFGLNASRGVAAIADGVTSALFSRSWAQLVIEATVACPPNLHDVSEFQLWLSQIQDAWLAGIDVGKLGFFQREKLRRREAGMTTLLWIEVLPLLASAPESSDAQPSQSEKPLIQECTIQHVIEPSNVPTKDNDAADRVTAECDGYELRCYSRGDCEIFHVRDGELLAMFPLDKAAGFGLDPAVIGGLDRNPDRVLEFQMTEGTCRPNDLLVLCTDALAQWAIQQWEAGQPVDWQRYWGMPAETWQEEMFALRREGRMRFDDTTLVLLRITKECPSSDAASGAAPVDFASDLAQRVAQSAVNIVLATESPEGVDSNFGACGSAPADSTNDIDTSKFPAVETATNKLNETRAP